MGNKMDLMSPLLLACSGKGEMNANGGLEWEMRTSLGALCANHPYKLRPGHWEAFEGNFKIMLPKDMVSMEIPPFMREAGIIGHYSGVVRRGEKEDSYLVQLFKRGEQSFEGAVKPILEHCCEFWRICINGIQLGIGLMDTVLCACFVAGDGTAYGIEMQLCGENWRSADRALQMCSIICSIAHPEDEEVENCFESKGADELYEDGLPDEDTPSPRAHTRPRSRPHVPLYYSARGRRRWRLPKLPYRLRKLFPWNKEDEYEFDESEFYDFEHAAAHGFYQDEDEGGFEEPGEEENAQRLPFGFPDRAPEDLEELNQQLSEMPLSRVALEDVVDYLVPNADGSYRYGLESGFLLCVAANEVDSHIFHIETQLYAKEEDMSEGRLIAAWYEAHPETVLQQMLVKQFENHTAAVIVYR